MNQLIVPLDSDILTPMNAEEAEACITEIITSHEHTGEKLLELHDREGWKAVNYVSWEECVRARFHFGHSHVYRLLAAEEVRRDIAPIIEEQRQAARIEKSPIGDKPIPESQLRPLTKLKKAEDRREAWKEVISQPEPVTAKRVKKIVSVRQRAQAAIRGTPMQSRHDAVRVLMQYHRTQGEEVFQGVLTLVATGQYDTPQKARMAYKQGLSPPPAPKPASAPPPRSDRVPPCPTCGCTRAACRRPN